MAVKEDRPNPSLVPPTFTCGCSAARPEAILGNKVCQVCKALLPGVGAGVLAAAATATASTLARDGRLRRVPVGRRPAPTLTIPAE